MLMNMKIVEALVKCAQYYHKCYGYRYIVRVKIVNEMPLNQYVSKAIICNRPQERSSALRRTTEPLSLQNTNTVSTALNIYYWNSSLVLRCETFFKCIMYTCINLCNVYFSHSVFIFL